MVKIILLESKLDISEKSYEMSRHLLPLLYVIFSQKILTNGSEESKMKDECVGTDFACYTTIETQTNGMTEFFISIPNKYNSNNSKLNMISKSQNEDLGGRFFPTQDNSIVTRFN